MAKKVAIVGTADTHRLAPYDDPEFEIWGVNNGYLLMKRFTRWFEIHNITHDGMHFYRRGERAFRGTDMDVYMQKLAELNVPVYMQQQWAQVPKSVVYPLAEVAQAFGSQLGWYNHEGFDGAQPGWDVYFTNTISYMIALAIFEGFTEIHIYGVDMAVDCLDPFTKVLTSDLRWVNCGDVQIGDELIGFDEHPSDGNGKTRRWRKTTVTMADRVMKHCYRIHFEDGTSIVASDNHGWLTHGENVNRWKTTEELFTSHHREGRPTRVLKVLNQWDNIKSWETGYLAAAFEGEGHINQTARSGNFDGCYTFQVAFSQRENVMYYRVKDILAKFNFDYSVRDANGCKTITIKGGKAENMRFLGLVRPLRLLDKFCVDKLGELQSIQDLAVVGIEDVGMIETAGIQTTTKTLIAEGLASHNTEYHWQRPSCEYFIGIAKGMGIKMYLPPQCDLLKTRFLYGFGEQVQDQFKLKLKNTKKSLLQRRNEAEQAVGINQKKLDQYIGAIAGIEEMEKTWS